MSEPRYFSERSLATEAAAVAPPPAWAARARRSAFIDGSRLHIRTGFGPQHGAKLFEDVWFDKVFKAAPNLKRHPAHFQANLSGLPMGLEQVWAERGPFPK